MNWRDELSANLKAMKFDFQSNPDPGEPSEMAAIILQAVSDFRKDMFFAGYQAGAQDAALDLEVEFNSDLNRLGAEKRYQELLSE